MLPTSPVITALLVEKAENLRKFVRETNPDERRNLEVANALIDLQVDKLRERLVARTLVTVAPTLKVG
jgi:hypothetical protein